MNKGTWLALTAAFALWSGAVQSAFTNLENAYETDTAHVRLPSGTPGDVVVDPCPACKSVRLKVDAQTQYLVGRSSPPVSLAAFRQAVEAQAGKRLVVVYYKLDSLIVTRIVLSAAN
jgi:hypothetical protein